MLNSPISIRKLLGALLRRISTGERKAGTLLRPWEPAGCYFSTTKLFQAEADKGYVLAALCDK